MNGSYSNEAQRALGEVRFLDKYSESVMRWAASVKLHYGPLFRAAQDNDAEIEELEAELQVEMGIMSDTCPYSKKLVFVSGDVIEATVSGYGHDGRIKYEMKGATYHDKPVEVDGFDIRFTESPAGELDFDIGYNLKTRTVVREALGGGMITSETELHAFGVVGGLEVIGSSYGEDNIDRVRDYAPELVADIDDCIKQPEQVGRKLMDLAHAPVTPDDHMGDREIRILRSYVAQNLEFDEMVPYAVGTNGVVVGAPDEYGTVHLDFGSGVQQHIVRPEVIILKPAPEYSAEDGAFVMSTNLHWQLQVEVISPDVTKESKIKFIPLTSLAFFTPLRELRFSLPPAGATGDSLS